VRNNLQVITNLLLFRGRMTPPATRAELEALAGRMQALAAVQARIYETETLDRVDFRAVLDDIATRLVDVAGDGQISLERDYEIPLDLDVSRAMPLGLLVYEIILNAARHAWPDDGRGSLIIEAKIVDGLRLLRFCDDGVGFVSADALAGLGTQLMRALAGEAQVELETVSRPSGGTTVSVRLL
jgi:two-component sensor histidine kinase